MKYFCFATVLYNPYNIYCFIEYISTGRLPFKPLDHSGQTPSAKTSPAVNKKRKLSDNESPSAKQLRISSAGLQNPKPALADGEHEVSSSSEAEVHADSILHKPSDRSRTIDKFFRPRSKKSEQDEITSTNQGVEVIDLIDETNNDSKSESNEVSEKNAADKQQGKDDSICDDKKEEVCGENKEEKENEDADTEDMDDENDVEVSFIEDTSVCEDALRTPGRNKAESVLKVLLLKL